MAAYLTIAQGPSRRAKKTWTVVNTTVEDEYKLMVSVFLPLMFEIQEDRIPQHQKVNLSMVYERFFESGKFLTGTDVAVLNDCLRATDYKEVDIPNDGKYFQPTLPGKFSPCSAAWALNGEDRSQDMKAVILAHANGEIDLTKFKKDTIVCFTK